MTESERKWIGGFESFYDINIEGEVRSWKYGTRYGIREREEPAICTQMLTDKGYRIVYLGISGIHKKRFWLVHRLIAQAFIPNPENKSCINHKNGIKTDNRIENLEWCTKKENTHHAFRTGLMRIANGERSGRAKLTEENVREIIASPLGIHRLGKKFGVNKSTIRDVRAGVIWNHVTGFPKANKKLIILK